MTPNNIIELNLIPNEATATAEEAITIAKAYEDFVVTTSAAYEATAFDLKRIKAKTKELDDMRKTLTAPLDESKKRIMDFFRKPLELLQYAESAVKRAMLAYQQEQARVAAEQQRKLDEAARAEEERKRKALEARAVKAEASGKDEKADALRAQAETVFVPAPVVQVNIPKTTGVSTREIWKYEVFDEKLVPREYLQVNEKKLGTVVRALKAQTNIPGVRAYKEDVISAGTI